MARHANGFEERACYLPATRRSGTPTIFGQDMPHIVNEHEHKVCLILQVLREARLYINPDKTNLFCLEIDFLGHHISSHGIEGDGKKADQIINWPLPKSATDVRSSLGLVRYLADYLPTLADHTGILTELMMKDSERKFPT